MNQSDKSPRVYLACLAEPDEADILNTKIHEPKEYILKSDHDAALTKANAENLVLREALDLEQFDSLELRDEIKSLKELNRKLAEQLAKANKVFNLLRISVRADDISDEEHAEVENYWLSIHDQTELTQQSQKGTDGAK